MPAVELQRSSYITRSLANPFAAYAFGFCIALSVYSLGYSDLYPPLQQSLIWFLLGTCAVSIVLAFTIGNVVDTCAYRKESVKFHVLVFIVLLTVFAVEVVANGGIPLVIGLSDLSFDYTAFGIPEVHVAFVGFCYFYAVYWFDLYLLQRRRVFLTLSVSATSTTLLMFSRGAFIITLVALVFVYVQRRGVSRRLLQSFGVIAVVTIWGFGLLGDVRTHGASGESIILQIGAANDRFVNSNIPTEFFWPYLYVSSPLANLQLNMTDRVATDSPATYFSLEFLPDFISKRIVPGNIELSSRPLLITDELAVSTMYGRSFFLMGWLGLLLSFSYFIVVSIFCLRILNGSKYLIATTAILSSLAFLNIFDTMYIFAGGILQVYAALFLHLFERPALA
jgi:ABC-type multidrug transport system fused ATPase/permease subunit